MPTVSAHNSPDLGAHRKTLHSFDVYQRILRRLKITSPSLHNHTVSEGGCCWTTATTTPCGMFCVVRFGVGGSLTYFTVSDDGMTATRNDEGRGSWSFLCATPSFNDGDENESFPLSRKWKSFQTSASLLVHRRSRGDVPRQQKYIDRRIRCRFRGDGLEYRRRMDLQLRVPLVRVLFRQG